MSAHDDIHCLLDRHQVRRSQSIPAVTVLCGPVGSGIYSLRAWARQRAVSVVVAARPEEQELIFNWIAELSGRRNLVQDALAWLAHRTGRGVEELRVRLSAMTLHDLGFLLQAESIDDSCDPAAKVCRWLLECFVSGEPLDAKTIVEKFRARVHSGDETSRGLLTALADLVSPGPLPIILLTPSREENLASWLDACSGLLGSLVTDVPALPAAIVAPATAMKDWLQKTPPTHWQALAREGMIPIEGVDAPALNQLLVAEGVDPAGLTPTLQKLAIEGIPAEVAASFAQAAAQVQKQQTQPTPEQEDAARSAAERFLFEQLESLAETAGLFALNQRLEFRHGPAPAEADLLAANLKLVIELDGSYYHLKDKEAYRRDRRKDWLLQQHGYLVLRFLAEDVVEQLEDILNTILTAVEFCRQGFTSKQGT